MTRRRRTYVLGLVAGGIVVMVVLLVLLPLVRTGPSLHAAADRIERGMTKADVSAIAPRPPDWVTDRPADAVYPMPDGTVLRPERVECWNWDGDPNALQVRFHEGRVMEVRYAANRPARRDPLGWLNRLY